MSTACRRSATATVLTVPASENTHDPAPGSPYAGEQRKKPFPLRFPPPIEDAYLEEHLRRTALALVFGVGLSVAAMLEEGSWSPDVLAHLFVTLPIAVVMTWLAWSRDRMRGYLQATLILAPVLGFTVAVAAAHTVSQGFAEEMASLMLLMITTFFFIGLQSRAATVAGLSILAGFAVTAPVAGVPVPLYLKCMAILSIDTATRPATSRCARSLTSSRSSRGDLWI